MIGGGPHYVTLDIRRTGTLKRCVDLDALLEVKGVHLEPGNQRSGLPEHVRRKHWQPSS
jgi:hypothetical protein